MNKTLIAKYLQALRKEKGYTQEDLAERLNVSRQAVSQWETGGALPDLELLLQISRLYKITINAILEPEIRSGAISDFEQIPELPEGQLKEILESFEVSDIIKASMGASPTVNTLLEKILVHVNFIQEQNKIGRVRLEEVESIQNQIVSLINLKILEE